MLEMGLAKVYPYTEFEVSSYTHSKDTAHVPLNGWIGVPKLTRRSSRFLSDLHKIWHHISRMVSA